VIRKNLVSLEELKQIVKEHMKKELDIMDIILQSDKNVVEEFHRWYISHPYVKGIEELRRVVRERADKEN
jgi:hypothetical protein